VTALHGSTLDIDGLSVRLPAEARPVLDRVTLRVESGEVVGVLGRSGCGKSTLLHAVAGLVPWQRPAEVRGDLALDGESLVELDPGQRAHLLATCLDRPEAQLFLASARHELEAARRLYGASPLADRVVDELELGPLLDRRITELSSGECQKVAVAVALCGSPRPVLLDEPTAHLDAAGARALARLLAAVRDEGGPVLVTEQAGWRLDGSGSRWVALDRGRLDPSPAPVAPQLPAPDRGCDSRVVLRASGLELRRGGQTLVVGAELELRAGEVVLVTGPNGAGKSTLARVVAGVERAHAGRVEPTGDQVALMLPQAELQLFATTVARELDTAGAGTEEVARVLRRHRLEHLAARAPWTLSRGERQRLVHAALDLLRPAVLVVDEPGQGLDPEDMVELVRLIHRRAAKGRAYLVISHRLELAAAAHRHFEIRGRELVEVARGGKGDRGDSEAERLPGGTG
jgi:energy-coupling factor transport system ATP-binding protein